MKRILFWSGFIIILALIIWGLVAAGNKTIDLTMELAVPVNATDRIIGNPDAPVTIVEYSDFQCPACALYYPVIEKLLAEASTTVKLVYRHYPLNPIPHLHAELSARVSEAAAEQGKFTEMYRKLFDTQKEWENLGSLAESGVVFAGYARELGLDMTKYAVDLISTTTTQKVANDRDGGVQAGVNSTPTFFVNGKSVLSPNNYEEFKALIEAAAK